MPRLLSIILATLSIHGCGPPCSDPTRINGDWLARTTTGTQTSGYNIEDHPLSDAPILSRTMPWDVRFRGPDEKVEITIGSFTHRANYSKAHNECDAFELSIRGVYEVETPGQDEQITQHEFLYEAKLRYTGPRITGTFHYQDEWMSMVDDRMGSLTVPDAELILSPRE